MLLSQLLLPAAKANSGKCTTYYLITNRKLTSEPWEELATELGLDIEKFNKDMQDEALAKQVEEDIALATKHGVRGTPGFFVNGVKLQGAQPLREFKRVIEECKKRKSCLNAG